MALLLLLIQITIAAMSAAQDSATWDESSHLAFGAKLLAGTLEHADMQRMPITAINALPQMACKALGIRLSYEHELFASRFPTLLFSALIGWLIFVWSRRLYGPSGALLSLTVFTFCPTILGHGRLITTDVASAASFFAATLAFVHYLRRPTWPRFFLAATVMGIAQISKHTALLLFPLFLIILLLRWRRGLPRFGKARGLLFFLLVVLIINAGYGFKGTGETLEQHVAWAHSNYGYPESSLEGDGRLRRMKAHAFRMPLPLPRIYVETFLIGQHYNRIGDGHGPVYLLGESSKLGWKYYFLVAFGLKTPLPTIALILVALLVVVRTRRSGLTLDELVCLLSAAGVMAYFSLLCTAQIGIRYLTPMLPFLYVLVGILAARPLIRGRWAWRMGGAAMLLWLAVSTLSYFPHYICYFNEICWDRRFLFRYLADSNLDWNQSTPYLDQYLKRHEGENIPVNPPLPLVGKFIVRANILVGLDNKSAAYRYLARNRSPIAHVAYAYLVYDLPGPLPVP